MISNPITYTQAEQALIDQKLASATFTKDTWSDADLTDLKEKIKRHYVKEQDNKCPYCRVIIRTNHGRVWDTEHIIPRVAVAKFMFEPKNLCACCIDCNAAKSDKKVTNSRAVQKLPINSKDYFLVHPHVDNYETNLLVIKEGFYYVALSKKGKNTIEICELNRFYEFAKFDTSISGDDRIFLLSEELVRTSDSKKRFALRKEIAFLAIQGNI